METYRKLGKLQILTQMFWIQDAGRKRFHSPLLEQHVVRGITLVETFWESPK